ncbi:S-type pyocin domain-containing protein [Pseudomonas chlororaphis]|uniref:S-type pyocin domain-containing protein n=1 Tax=Pseudomonas chlororaphis TaxID=587753 RepID=UPI0003FD8B8D|nr:S-type pyocin domain-containing protein [Pseudomonas chlororaphis]
MSGYVANNPKGYRNKGIEPVDLGALRWAEYKDLPAKAETKLANAGCTFTKPCKLADGVINYASSFIPTEAVKEYGEFALLGGRETDAAGNLRLGRISGSVPPALGGLMLGANALVPVGASCGGLCGTAASGAFTSGVVAGGLLGVIAMLVPSSLGDSALYTEEQLKSLKEGRTRVRLHIEEQADGTLKGYGYNTEKRRDWEMIPVVRFQARDQQQVADFGDGVTLIWTPAVDPSSTSGIPPLEAAPQAPPIWIYPPTEQADTIIVNPLYPPEYQDFILVFPPGSGVQPLYIVMNVRFNPGVVTGEGKDAMGIWLAGAGIGLGSPVPAVIATQLRGKSFGSFNSFRRALWKAIANCPEFAGQFTDNNIDRMRAGSAPKARYRDRAGKRGSFELHHLDHIAKGGSLYDVDNLSVVTPKHHIDIHRKG